MPALSPEQWREISPYLDEAAAIPDSKRASWLLSLRDKNPRVARIVEELLEEQRLLKEEGFLEDPPLSLSDSASLAGRNIGAYTLISLTGQGGMGSVWRARRNDGRFEGVVALKFLSLAVVGRAGEERFRREGNILARLAHPNIAKLLDAGVSATGQHYSRVYRGREHRHLLRPPQARCQRPGSTVSRCCWCCSARAFKFDRSPGY
jgi:serine/threonine-protein kinase